MKSFVVLHRLYAARLEIANSWAISFTVYTSFVVSGLLVGDLEAALKTLDSIPPEVIRFYENRSTQEPVMRHDK